MVRGTITWRCEADECHTEAVLDDIPPAGDMLCPPGWWAIHESDPNGPRMRWTTYHYCSRRCCLLAATAALLSDAA